MTGTRSLVADIGATNARFGLLDASGRLLHTQTLPCTGHKTLEEAARAYLDAAHPDAHPVEGAIAIAGPVTGDLLTMTNHPWTFSVKGTRDALGLDRLVVVNDFTAAAMAIPRLTEADRLKVGDPAPDFTLPAVDGKETVTLSAFKGKRPVVLIFASYT